MPSSTGNSLHGSAAFSGLTSSFIIGSEQEPDSSSREGFGHQHPSGPPEMGLSYMSIPPLDDARFDNDSRTPHSLSTAFQVDNITATAPSTLPFSTYPTCLSTPPSYPSHNHSYFSQVQSNYCEVDFKPQLSLYNPLQDMAPSSRSPQTSHHGGPVSKRELYASSIPQLHRAAEPLSRSPQPSGMLRGAPLSPESSSGLASPTNMDGNQLSSRSKEGVPPLDPTVNHYQLQTSDGQGVRPEILGKIEKGFFLAEGDWTCYRRNYFQLSCSYTLHPYLPTATLYVIEGGQSRQIFGFSMSIMALVDGREGVEVSLIQHTPKRDKGPQTRPDRATLLPRAPPAMYGSMPADGHGGRSMFDPGFSSSTNQTPTEHTFERVQFKQATANNGKRRAAQQYYHIVVELYADIGTHSGDSRWLKVAHRVSAQLVVRGRSPGHYHADRRGSQASAGPGGSDSNLGNPFPPGGASDRSQVDMGASGSSSMLSGGYSDNYDPRSHQYISSSSGQQINMPTEPIMSSEEVKNFREYNGYLYYPSTINEPHIGMEYRGTSIPNHPYERRGQDHGMEYSGSPKIKHEYQTTGINLPSIATGPSDTYGRQCGRFEGFPTSRGYYPLTVFSPSEINSS